MDEEALNNERNFQGTSGGIFFFKEDEPHQSHPSPEKLIQTPYPTLDPLQWDSVHPTGNTLVSSQNEQMLDLSLLDLKVSNSEVPYLSSSPIDPFVPSHPHSPFVAPPPTASPTSKQKTSLVSTSISKIHFHLRSRDISSLPDPVSCFLGLEKTFTYNKNEKVEVEPLIYLLLIKQH